jgi:hypothetical protein
MKRVRYLATAGLLGLGWFAVLLVPGWTRAWLSPDLRGAASNAALLVVTSMAIAWIFRRVIARASSWRDRWLRAALLPYVGCVLYLTLWNAVEAARGLAHGAPFQAHDAAVLYVWGLGQALLACFVVVPFGLLCQWALERLTPPAEAPERSAAPAG